MVQKLLELEVSMDGLSKRRGMINKIHGILSQDWEDLETILVRGPLERDGGVGEDIEALEEELQALNTAAER